MNDFFKTVVDMLQGNGFLEYPKRRRGLKSKVAIMVRDGHLVVVHGPYESEYVKRASIVVADPIVSQFDPEQDRLDAIQHEFDKYLERVILPIIDYYVKELGLKSVKFVMPSGGGLKLPADMFESRGIKVTTGKEIENIRIDIPGMSPLVP